MDLFLGEGRRGMAAGDLPPRDLTITSGALLGATRYVMTDWAISEDAYPIDEVLAELARLCLLAMGA